MMIYSQSTGQLWRDDGAKCAVGYSGFGEGKNNPELQHVKSVGPIPRGKWAITGMYDSKRVGPKTLVLEPVDHDMLGRDYFRIHGDSVSNPGTASKGCIIFPPQIRLWIHNDSSRQLEVVE